MDTTGKKITTTHVISLHCNELNIDEIQALRQIYFYLLEYCFLLVVTIGSEHRPNKRITSTLQKQINKKILKERTEPQTYTLIVKENIKGTNRATDLYTYREKKTKCMNHTRGDSHYRECMTIHKKPQLSSPILTVKAL